MTEGELQNNKIKNVATEDLLKKIKRLTFATNFLDNNGGKVIVSIGNDSAYVDVSDLISADMGHSQVLDILNGELISSQELFAKL